MTHKEFIKNYLRYIKYHIKDGILYVDDNLNLQGSNIITLPEKLHIDGSLDLYRSMIVSLPKRLTVGSWLDLEGTNITLIPKRLIVGGFLDLRGSKITSLPKGMVVGDKILSDKKLSMIEKTQIDLIKQYKYHLKIIKIPTKKAVSLHKLLWEI